MQEVEIIGNGLLQAIDKRKLLEQKNIFPRS